MWDNIDFKLTTFEHLSNFELFTLLKARCDVFVVEQNCAYGDIDETDLVCWHLLGFATNQLACYARVIPPCHHTTGLPAIGRVLTTAGFRGQNLSRELMRQAIGFCQDHYPNLPIFIAAQHYLIDFYQSLGFVTQGDRYLEDNIWHINMVLK